nr:MAG TPA: hypothetical protein [Caudoviricetes sp.]
MFIGHVKPTDPAPRSIRVYYRSRPAAATLWQRSENNSPGGLRPPPKIRAGVL